MRIIDFRFRPNTPETLSGIANSAMFKGLCATIDFDKMKPQSLEEVVADLARHHVVKAVITGRDCETTFAAKSNNPSVLEFMSKFPDLFFGFAGVDPHKGMRGIYELKTLVEEKGFKGAAIDPYLAQIYVNDAKYYPIYAKCCELDIPVVITTGPATLVPNTVIDHVAPRYIDFVARDFPELKIVVSHGGYPWVNEMIMVTQRNANVYLELSEYEFFPQSEAYIQAINSLITDKVVFASAHPFVDFRVALKNYETIPFKEDVREKIMYKNAARILKIAEKEEVSAGVGNEMERMIIESVLKELAKRGMVAGK